MINEKMNQEDNYQINGDEGYRNYNAHASLIPSWEHQYGDYLQCYPYYNYVIPRIWRGKNWIGKTNYNNYYPL